MGICSVEDCSAPAKARGWCGKHHQRWLRSGGSLPPVQRVPTISRYLAKVARTDDPNDCWIWTGGRDKDGYGIFWDGTYTAAGRGHDVRVTRWTYEQFVGPLPADQKVLHRCDRPSCVNPAHLFIGSTLDNNADRAAKGRSNPDHGSHHVGSKLTESQVRSIRERYAAGGISHQALADEFGVSQALIGPIIRRLKWAHVE